MFEGGFPEQFHQFTVGSTRTPSSSSTSSLSSSSVVLPLSFPLHAVSTTMTTTTFDPYPSHSPPPPLFQLQPQLRLLPHKLDINSSELKSDQRSIPNQLIFDIPWTNDEVLSLLRIRSSIENWLPDFTWEHVSRKLAELGYRRSGEICKQKFEEETRQFDNMSSSYTMKNYTRYFFSELEQLCHGENSSQVLPERNLNVIQKLPNEEEVDNIVGQQINLVEDSRDEELLLRRGKSNSSPHDLENDGKESESKKRRRHRRRKFKMLKGFCEDILNEIMAHQEELQNKIIDDMLKKEEEKIAREEAWKKQEIYRMNKEVEIRAHELAIASDRQNKLIELLKTFTSTNSSSAENESSGKRNHENETFSEISKGGTSFSSTSGSLLIQPQNPNASDMQNPSSSLEQNNPSNNRSDRRNPNSTVQPKQMREEDLGKRWPRDQVLALINLRWSHNSSSTGISEDKDSGGVAKVPLWERISKGMLELGYKRSAKRCKEKWENINKYFRKTKDVNKKRSVDSRTCPYFHQLNTLYGQGTSLAIEAPIGQEENHSVTPGKESPPTAQAHLASVCGDQVLNHGI